jgi:hypothetical protein
VTVTDDSLLLFCENNAIGKEQNWDTYQPMKANEIILRLLKVMDWDLLFTVRFIYFLVTVSVQFHIRIYMIRTDMPMQA